MTRHHAKVVISVGVLTAAAVVATATAVERSGSGGVRMATTSPSARPVVATSVSTTPAAAKGGQQTLAALRRAAAKAPRSVEAHMALADALYLDRRYPEAITTYEEVLDLRPDYTTATVRLAMVWHAQGRSALARTAIEEVIAAHPSDQEAHYSLAMIAFARNRLGEAEAEWRTAAAIDPMTTLGRRSRSFVDLLEGDESSSEGD